MVAMGLLVVVLTAALPAFLGMLRSTVTTKMETQAKNLTQERLEQMRDLRFHVDRQNGPFLDVLDVYYTNAKSAGTISSVTASGSTLTGNYVMSGAATAALPAAPFYKTTTGALSGATAFSQVIAAQFLAPDGTAVPASRFVDIYDSQVVGKDQAPSLMLGVTVTTSWSDRATIRTYKAYTRITDGRPQLPVIQSQAKAVAVDITSTGADGATLELQGGLATADGAQSSGSSVSGFATGALATRTGYASVSGTADQFNFPTTAASTSGSSGPQSGPSCSWYGFGSTGTTNVNGDVSAGLPLAPSNVAAPTPALPPNVLTGYIRQNGSGGCGQLSYDNTAGGGLAKTSGDVLGYEMGGAPFVKVPNVGSGSFPAIFGSGYVMSNSLTSTPQTTRAGSSAGMAQQVVLFPNNPESGSQGLVQATLTSGSVDCTSGSASANGTVVGKYDVTLKWWGRGPLDVIARMHTARWTYDSTLSATPLLQSGSDTWAPASTFLGNGTTLSQLVTSPTAGLSPSVLATGATTGLRGFTSPILSLTSASTLTNEASPGFSAIKVDLGQLTCVADDQR